MSPKYRKLMHIFVWKKIKTRTKTSIIYAKEKYREKRERRRERKVEGEI